MGLQNQLTDISSESLPIFLLAGIANVVCHLRSFLFSFLHSLGLSRHHFNEVDENIILLDTVDSGLTGLITLTEQLNLNRVFSYKYMEAEVVEGDAAAECVFCLNTMSEGEKVRKLGCQHVFHKDCFDGWLDHMNFNCPLCRAVIVSNERVNTTRRRMASDVLAWFSL